MNKYDKILGEYRELDAKQFANKWFVSSETGNDTNNGNSEETAFATICKAIESCGEDDLIDVLDSAAYSCSITIPTKVTLNMPFATLSGAISLATSSRFIAKRHYPSANGQTMVSCIGTSGSAYTVNGMNSTGYSDVIHFAPATAGGYIVANCKHITVGSSTSGHENILVYSSAGSTGVNIATDGTKFSSDKAPFYGYPADLVYGDTGYAQWTTSVFPLVITYDTTTGKTVSSYKMKATSSGTRMPKDWTLHGQLSGGSWVLLDTRSSVTWTAYEEKEFTIATPASYDKYRITVASSTHGTILQIDDIGFWAGIASVGGDVMIVSDILSLGDYAQGILAHDSGQRAVSNISNIYQTAGTSDAIFIDMSAGAVSHRGNIATADTLWNKTGGTLLWSVAFTSGTQTGDADYYHIRNTDLLSLDQNIIPLADSAINLGSATKYFLNSYIDNGYFSTGIRSPKIYPITDSTTAFQINKADGTTNVLNVDTTNGRVGIGTTSPKLTLQVGNSAGLYQAASNYAEFVNNGYYSGGWKRINASGGGVIEFDPSGNYSFNTFPIGAADSAIAFTAALYIKQAGNVGIGTTTPDYKLQVNGTIAPETDSVSDLGTSALYWANSYVDKMHVATDVFWTSLFAAGDTLYGAPAGGMNTTSQVAILPKNTQLNADSASAIFALWVERTANRSAFTNGNGVNDFAAISGRLQISDENLGYGSQVAALVFNPYMMKDYANSPVGTFYQKNNGLLIEGSQSWFSNDAKIQNARAFNGQGVSHGFFSTMILKEYSASFYGRATVANPSASLVNPNEFIFYAEKPTQATRNWQSYLVGTGAGTGQVYGGELDFLELITSTNDIYPTASHGWTLGANWAFSTDGFKHTAGSTAVANLPNAKMTSGKIKNGKTYAVVVKITERTAGSITISLGAATANVYPGNTATASSNKCFVAYITAALDNVDVVITPSSDFDGKFRQVSVTQISSWNHCRVFSSAASILDLAVDVNGTETTIAQAKSDRFSTNKIIMPVQATTASAPAYVKGAIYFDTTRSKLMVGGASAWETITSV